MSIITQRGNLADIVVTKLRERIDSGLYAPGDKIPSSEELGQEFGVSRTVIREAQTSLKAAGLVITRQGAGVYVTHKEARALDFEIGRIDDIRAAVDILELRLGVEMQCAVLAAERRTPENIKDMAQAFDRIHDIGGTDAEAEATADFDFHLAIARATHNPHFPRFLTVVMGDINFDLLLKYRTSGSAHDTYRKKNAKQHAAILASITLGDAKAAKQTMAAHLEEGLNRYRSILNDPSGSDAP